MSSGGEYLLISAYVSLSEPSSYKRMVITSSILPFFGNPFFSDRTMRAEGRQIAVQASLVTAKVRPWKQLFGEVI